MEIILLERVRNLGFMGDIVSVKRGYARNFLLPQKKALRVNEENKIYFEEKKKEIEAQNIERKSEAEKVKNTFKDTFVSIIRSAGDTGQLYGSVTKRDVVDALNNVGLILSATQIILDRPIKILGIHNIKLELYPDVYCEVKLNVAISEDAAEYQEKTGKVHGLFIKEDKVKEVVKKTSKVNDSKNLMEEDYLNDEVEEDNIEIDK